MTEKIFTFPELTQSLDSWAEFLPDSPAASFLRKRFDKDIGSQYKMHSARFLADIACFMSAVYVGGLKAGVNSVDTTVKHTTLYRAFEVHDEYHRDKSLIGVYTTNAAAEAAVKGKGWFGSDGVVIKGDAYFVGDYIIFPSEKIDAVDLDVNLPERLEDRKAAALAKLTDEEKKLLGLV